MHNGIAEESKAVVRIGALSTHPLMRKRWSSQQLRQKVFVLSLMSR